MARQDCILVVDDEPDIAGLLVALLESEGYCTTLARSGSEALDLISRVKPVAIVLDLSLPDVDGLEVLRRLKACKASAAIPVIVLSAYTGRLTAKDKALLHAVFEKPFNLDEFTGTVGRLCEEACKPVVRASLRQRGTAPRSISIA